MLSAIAVSLKSSVKTSKREFFFHLNMFINYLQHCGAEDDSRVPWTARRSNQSTINEINLEYSLEGLMLKQKHQYFGSLMQQADSLENTLMLGKIEGRRRRGQ